MEHRRDRHVDVVPRGSGPARPTAGKRHVRCQRVQHELAVAEVHALRQAGRAGGVEGRGAGVLVEVREVVVRRRARRAAPRTRRRIASAVCGALAVVRQHDDVLHARRCGPGCRSSTGRKSALTSRIIVLGVVDRVEDLLRRQAHVHRVQHGAHHRHGEVALEVAVAVPVHHRDGVAGRDAERWQARRPAARSRCAERAVVVAHQVAVDDLLVGRVAQRRQQQLLDQQRIAIGGRSRLGDLADAASQHVLPLRSLE